MSNLCKKLVLFRKTLIYSSNLNNHISFVSIGSLNLDFKVTETLPFPSNFLVLILQKNLSVCQSMTGKKEHVLQGCMSIKKSRSLVHLYV